MIRVFGIGADGLPSLSARAHQALSECKTLFGGQRHLALLPDGPQKNPWPKPWRLPLEEIEAADGPVGVLVSGDPSWFSAASALYSHFPCQVFPVPGAFALAAARMGWALEEVTTGTIHGRGENASVEAAGFISSAGGKHLILADKQSLNDFITALNQLAFSPIESMTLLCDMGADAEARLVLDLDDPILPDTNLFTIAIEVPEQPRLLLDADFLPDEAFESHGKITKFDARQSAIAHLARAEILWDVGAGAGTVGLQAGFTLAPNALFLIESSEEALRVLERNCANSSAPATIVEARAPTGLETLPTPDAIFIGGGLSDPDLIEVCWSALADGGRLVAHAVTLESEAVLLAFFASHPGAKLNRIQVSAADPVGGLHGWRPAMPLTQLVIEKS